MSSVIEKNLEADYKILLSWRYNKVEFLGLPSLKESRPVTLEDIYVPLSFSWEIGSKERIYLPEALERDRHLVVLGDPGCGKSTLVKVITHSFGRAASSPLSARFGDLLPVPIILREYNVRNWKTYKDMLTDFISTLDEEVRDQVTVEWLMQYLGKGRGFLLLDGIDEVGHVEARKHLRNKIIYPLLERFHKSYIILTSRLVGYEEAAIDVNWAYKHGEFKNKLNRCYVAPFNDEDITQFIHRWYAVRESDSSIISEGVSSLQEAIQQNDRIKRLASNPSLLTLIALVHRVLARLPSSRVKLYDKIVEAYLETIADFRRLEKFPATLEQMKRWLGRVGWEMQELRDSDKDNQIIVDESEVLRWLKEAIENDDREDAEDEAEKFLDYVARRSGFLIPIGAGRYAFWHLTFQEYFAAFHTRSQYSRFEQLTKVIKERIDKQHWHETFCVLFEMLSEFKGIGDDIADTLIPDVTDEDKRRATAVFFSSLLIDEENGLSAGKKREVVAFTLKETSRLYSDEIMKNLTHPSGSHLYKTYCNWFDEMLDRLELQDLSGDFFVVGNDLIANFHDKLGEWMEKVDNKNFDRRQKIVITAVGASNINVCKWASSSNGLSIKDWLSPMGYWYGESFSLADSYKSNIASLSNISSHHHLLAQLSSTSSLVKGQFLKATVIAHNLDLALALDRARALALDLALDRALALALALDRARARARDFALARALALDLALDRARARARALALALALALARDFALARDVSHFENKEVFKDITEILVATEDLFFLPNADVQPAINHLQEMVSAKDNWTQLLALNALLTLGAGSVELCNQRNSLLDKGIKKPNTFTFPETLHDETETEDFRQQLPEILQLVFLYYPNEPEAIWLKPEFFDPSRPVSEYMLSKPKEFFILAADALDPKGETDLGKWRREQEQ